MPRSHRLRLGLVRTMSWSLLAVALAGIFPVHAAPPGTLSKVQQLLSLYRLAEAEAAVQPLLDGPQASEEVFLAAGRIKEEIGDLPEARRFFESAVGANPDSVAAHCFLARVLLGSKDLRGAARQLRAALKLAPDSVLPLAMGGLYYLQKGNYSMCQRYLDKALAADPGSKEALLAQADLQFLKRDLDGAQRTMQGLLRSHPADPDGLYMLGIVLFNQKDYKGAQGCLERATSIHRYAANFLKDLAQVYAQNERLEQAIASLDRVLLLAPGDESALSLRSNLKERQALLATGVRRAVGPFRFVHPRGLPESTFLAILQVFQSAYESICRETGYHPPQVQVWIFEKTGALLPAFYSHVSDEIIISSSYFSSIDTEEKRRLGRHLIFHEFSHLVLYQSLGRPSFSPMALWLMEGLAEKQAGGYDYTSVDYDKTFGAGLLDLPELADYLPVSAIGTGEKREKAYIQAYLMADFLLRRSDGLALIKKMILAYAGGQSDQEVLEGSLGITPADFLEQVGQFIRGSYID